MCVAPVIPRKWKVLMGKCATFSFYKEATGETILKILMNKPTTINKKETTKIKLHFDSQFDVLSPANKVLGKDKMASIFLFLSLNLYIKILGFVFLKKNHN